MALTLERSLWNLGYRRPQKQDTMDRMEAVRAFAQGLAQVLFNTCPESRERSEALTNLESCVMWAMAALARNESEDAPYG